MGQPYAAREGESSPEGARSLPKSRCATPCVAELSVPKTWRCATSIAPRCARAGACASATGAARARDWIAGYGIKTQGEDAPIRSLSGGNVQRAVLARELAGEINVLIAANPVFGLDFAAVAEIHQRIVQVRARGGAVLLISEDLDELLELADRIVVMSEGRIVFETPAATAERHVLGAHMGGGDHSLHQQEAA
jgi:simple sugar transport system ATP-binding protein